MGQLFLHLKESEDVIVQRISRRLSRFIEDLRGRQEMDQGEASTPENQFFDDDAPTAVLGVRAAPAFRATVKTAPVPHPPDGEKSSPDERGEHRETDEQLSPASMEAQERETPQRILQSLDSTDREPDRGGSLHFAKGAESSSSPPSEAQALGSPSGRVSDMTKQNKERTSPPSQPGTPRPHSKGSPRNQVKQERYAHASIGNVSPSLPKSSETRGRVYPPSVPGVSPEFDKSFPKGSTPVFAFRRTHILLLVLIVGVLAFIYFLLTYDRYVY